MLTLKRVAYTETETAGVLIMDGFPFILTLEDPWKENEPFVSCIPKGNYLCKRVISHKFGQTFQVTGVQGRDRILFHKGNTHENTQGCILVGTAFETVGLLNGVIGSKGAFSEFMGRLKGLSQFQLLITG